MKDKLFFQVDDMGYPNDSICSGTEEIHRNDIEVFKEFFHWYQIALTDEIIKELDE